MSVRACVASLPAIFLAALSIFRVVGNNVPGLHREASLIPAFSRISAIDPGTQDTRGIEGWFGEVTAQIEREEYRASVSGRALQAPNRAHNLRTYFREGGIEVVPRSDGARDAWSFQWRTVRWGRGDRMIDVTRVSCEPCADGSRVTYVREDLEEWYENKREGLEQGFVVQQRPSGEGPLRIEGHVGRGFRAEYAADGKAIDFTEGSGARVLRYAELHVHDASGHEVPSHLHLEGDRVAIVVDDARAAYPITVDPLLTSPSWTAESNQFNAYFAFSVSTAGDVNGDGYSDVIVGAAEFDNGQTDEGRAFVYHGSAAGLALTPAWTAESNQTGANLGRSVATAGDVNSDGYCDVIVGAPWYDNGQTDEGRVFVFHGSAGGLAPSPAWTAESDQAEAWFGNSVGTAGDVNGDCYADVVVGAPNYDNARGYDGRAYVYHGSSEGLSLTADWTADSDQDGASLGYSLGTAGDVNADGYSDVIVAAASYDNGETDEGRVYAYHGSAAGLSLSPAWTVEGGQEGAQLGYSVAAAGDVNGDGYSDVVVGAPWYDNGQTDEGRVYVYHGSAGGLALAAAWTAESNQAEAYFGRSAGTAGDVNGDGFSDVIVGASEYSNGQMNEGRAFVYHGRAGGLSPSPAWTAESNQTNAQFGRSVRTAGDVNGDGYSDVIIGAHSYDNGQTNEGRAYVFHGAAGGLSPGPGWTAESDQASASFGVSVCTVGDVNGDGYSDVAIGAPYFDNGQTDEGRVFVYVGSASGLAPGAAWTAESDQVSARFGQCVAAAGDVNGDGYSDIIVGANLFDGGETDEGRTFVYHGSADGLATSPAWTAESNQAGASFGYSAGTAGDVNGDGFSDVIVGAHGFDNGQTNEGRVFVYHGSAGGLSPSAAWTAESDQAEAFFGISVGTAGDVNRDAHSDVIVGAYRYDNGQSDEGRAFVYHGSANGVALVSAWTAESDQTSAIFGCSVGTAGDVNGDGYSDVIVGAPLFDNGQTDEGRAHVFHGSPAGLGPSPAWTAEGNQMNVWFGFSAGTAGDVNGDGCSDVVVGSWQYDKGRGRALAYHGSAGGLAPSPAWTAESDQAGANFGRSVGTAGDVNGDGYSDVIIGAERYDSGQTDEGRAFVYYGNEGAGLDRIARQARADGTAPIAPLGLSGSPDYDRFLLEVVGRTPAGRGNVRLQFEVKPLGAAFDGTGLVTGPACDTGSPGGAGSAVHLSERVTGLAINTLHRWRVRTVSDSPFFPRSPWFSLPYNCVTEADVRVGGTLVGIGSDGYAPNVRLFARIAPNPFGGSTHLTYTLPERGRVRLVVYDVAGRRVAVLMDSEDDAGRYTVEWDGTGIGGSRLPSGVYFVQLQFGDHREARKIVLTR